MPTYRYYQADAAAAVQEAWAAGRDNVLAVLPTGAGKTVLFAGILADFGAPSVAIAHRQELVGQISAALNRAQVRHRIIAPPATVRRICAAHRTDTGVSHYDPNAPCAVAGVDTILNKSVELNMWLSRVRLWVVDEAHHLLKTNKWGKAVAMFANAKGLGVTATPIRASGEGLGSHAQGLFDTMVEGPTMREMIDDGWLTDYRIFAPQSDIELAEVAISKASGDFSPSQLKKAVRKSHIIGDVVDHYRRIAPGKLAVVFASDVETASDMSGAFNAAGVVAEVVSAKTPDNVRAEIMRRYARRDITVLVNVDLFGEGFDLPAIEVVIMARPTQSFALFCQQFGRALRLMLAQGVQPPQGRDDSPARRAMIAASSKPRAIIIDHVGNVVRHGLPDAGRVWTLDAAEKRSRAAPDDVETLTACLNVLCMHVYERVLPACPFCGSKPAYASRSAPEFVDGDLTELDPDMLAQMRGEVARVDLDAEAYRASLLAKHAPAIGIGMLVRKHGERQEAQAELRDGMAWWAAYHRDAGRGDAETYRRFYREFKIDALAAQALGAKDAGTLAGRIWDSIENNS